MKLSIPSLIIICIAMLCLSCLFQVLASVLVAEDGFGGQIEYKCEKCSANKVVYDGRQYSSQIITIPQTKIIFAGDPNCKHHYFETHLPAGDGAITHLVRIYIKLSQIAFIIGVIFLLMFLWISLAKWRNRKIDNRINR